MKAISNKFPKPILHLWEGWTACAFCGGFWLALALHALTGMQSMPVLSVLPLVLDWLPDGLVTAMLTLAAAVGVDFYQSDLIT